MEDNLQPIEGGSILKALADLFFKGLDKMLAEQAEYEEEMGVLKQVNRIPIVDKAGHEHTLTVKLAPVRDKEGVFYAEASCDDKTLDVSEINGVALRLNNVTLKDFKQKIADMLAKQGYTSDILEDVPSAEPQESEDVEPESEQSDDKSDKTSEASQDLVDAANAWLSKSHVAVQHSSGAFCVVGGSVELADPSVALLTVEVEGGAGGDTPKGVEPQEYEITLTADNNELITENEFFEKIDSCIDSYLRSNKFKLETKQYVKGNSTISATFKKDSETGDIAVTAISASSNIKASLDAIYAVTDNDTFVASLEDGAERSFEISDLGDDGYDVEEIEKVDVSGTYDVLFGAFDNAWTLVEGFRWAVGDNAWVHATFLWSAGDAIHNLRDYAGALVVRNTNMYPVAHGLGQPYLDLSDAMTAECKVDCDVIINKTTELLNDLLETIDLYRANLHPEEQTCMDAFVNNIKDLLCYE